MTIFMPIKTDTPFLSKKVSNKNAFSGNAFKDSSYTVESFLAALKYNPLAAKDYISKNYIDKIDLTMIPLPNGVNTPLLIGEKWDRLPSGCNVHTVLTFCEEGACFLYFYTFKEPNAACNYKIYCIEKEYLE